MIDGVWRRLFVSFVCWTDQLTSDQLTSDLAVERPDDVVHRVSPGADVDARWTVERGQLTTCWKIAVITTTISSSSNINNDDVISWRHRQSQSCFWQVRDACIITWRMSNGLCLEKWANTRERWRIGEARAVIHGSGEAGLNHGPSL